MRVCHCPRCEGAGPDEDPAECTDCEGGYQPDPDEPGSLRECPTCHGSAIKPKYEPDIDPAAHGRYLD